MTKPLDEKTFETVGKLAGGADSLPGMPGAYVPLGAGYAAAVPPAASGGGSSLRLQTPGYTVGMPGHSPSPGHSPRPLRRGWAFPP